MCLPNLDAMILLMPLLVAVLLTVLRMALNYIIFKVCAHVSVCLYNMGHMHNVHVVQYTDLKNTRCMYMYMGVVSGRLDVWSPFW